MQQSNDSSIMYFIFPQTLCVCTYLLIVAILGAQQIATVHFWYSLPILIFIMIPLQYLMFWYPNDRKCKNFAFNICNGIFLFITMCIFFGVYFGLFFSTIKYTLEEVEDCQVIGKQSVNINGVDSYSILYVDFNQDGKQNMLGYGCQSSNDIQSAGYPYILPHQFYQSNDPYYCTNMKDSYSYQKSKRQLYNQRARVTAPANNQKPSLLTCFYNWSAVKLADWMCQSNSMSYEDLTKKQKCYVHYFKNNLNTQSAFQNSKDRVKLKEALQFAMVTFNPLPVPVTQYMCLIIFIFCPFITSLSVIFNIFTLKIVKHILNKRQLNKAYLKVGIFQLKERTFITQQPHLTEDRIQLIHKSDNLKVEEGSPPLTKLSASLRQFQQEDVIVEPLNLNDNLTNFPKRISQNQQNNDIEDNSLNPNNINEKPDNENQNQVIIDQVQIKIQHKKSNNQDQQNNENNQPQNPDFNSSFQLINESEMQEKQQNEEQKGSMSLKFD